MKHSCLIFILSLCSLTLFAQKQANIWHFGNGQALDFSTGAPVQIGGSLMETFEGSASYCDSLGNLLFSPMEVVANPYLVDRMVVISGTATM